MVDNQPNLHEILRQFDVWLEQSGLVVKEGNEKLANSWTFVTCGDWDLGTMLPSEAKYRNIQLPK